MSWLVLVVSGALEAVWATALGRSDGLSRPVPATVFAVGPVLSMLGLAFAMRELPTGTAYAVWVGIGAAATVAVVMVTGGEAVSVTRLVFLVRVVGWSVSIRPGDRCAELGQAASWTAQAVGFASPRGPLPPTPARSSCLSARPAVRPDR